MTLIFFIAASAFVIVCVVIHVLVRAGGRLQILDYPNARSSHATPIPRTGGLAIWAGSLVAIAATLWSYGVRVEFVWIICSALLVGVVSFMDDRSGVRVRLRFAAHVTAGILLLLGGLWLKAIQLPGLKFEMVALIGFLVSLLFIVWMLNLYNFMDGMDGFAGGMAVFGFGAVGILGWLSGDMYFAVLAWIVAAAAGGFLVLNFPPARIFMGDTGSSVLGLLAAAFALWGDRLGLFPLWIAILVFSPFIVDATVTLLRRLIRRERIWEAHRRHYYQRLVQLGWGHRKTVLAEYLLMLLCAMSGILAVQLAVSAQWAIILFWAAVYTSLILFVEYLERQALLRNEKLS